jgi:hypothetical protein
MAVVMPMMVMGGSQNGTGNSREGNDSEEKSKQLNA